MRCHIVKYKKLIYNTLTESGDNMSDLFEYIKKFGAFRFSNMGINEVDNAVFSRLAYIDLSPFVGKTLGEAAEKMDGNPALNKTFKTLSETVNLLKAAGNTIRYGYVTIEDCRETVSENMQTAFYAVTFAADKNTFFIAFRGTDDKIVGFYEDAKLAYAFPISSQISALSYVTEQLSERNGEFFLGGHSKGGNLAVFAFLFLKEEEKDRIIRVYNNDGPGFPQQIADILFTRKNCEKIQNLLPEDSIIGRMLTDGGKIKIVKSSANGAAQHNIFTWEINGAGFKEAKKFSLLSEYMEDSLTQSLESLPPERMKDAADAVFEIAKKSGIKTLKDINIKNYKSLLPAVGELRKLVDDDTEDIPVIVRTLAKSLVESLSIDKIIERSMPDVMNKIDEFTEKLIDKTEEHKDN